ncbi:hypothetical protein NPIL_692161 [Nephila pilipes]|uniref:Uncharacterized protein n=1 Tax=Nephila pilipes TaxID=299642 RepID=A0A8X6TR16_NEPPI|nr:hypothetical protein NPIL_692161 [Nephila pilipes]
MYVQGDICKANKIIVSVGNEYMDLVCPFTGEALQSHYFLKLAVHKLVRMRYGVQRTSSRFASSLWYNFSPAMEWDAPISADIEASIPQILRTIKLDGDVDYSNVNKLTLFTVAFSSPLDLELLGQSRLYVPRNLTSITLDGSPF